MIFTEFFLNISNEWLNLMMMMMMILIIVKNKKRMKENEHDEYKYVTLNFLVFMRRNYQQF